MAMKFTLYEFQNYLASTSPVGFHYCSCNQEPAVTERYPKAQLTFHEAFVTYSPDTFYVSGELGSLQFPWVDHVIVDRVLCGASEVYSLCCIRPDGAKQTFSVVAYLC